MRAKKPADRTAFSASVLQFSENLIKKLENIRNVNPQPQPRTQDKQPERKKLKIQDDFFRVADLNEKENQFQQLLNSMDIKSLCEMNAAEDKINHHNEFFDCEYPLE